MITIEKLVACYGYTIKEAADFINTMTWEQLRKKNERGMTLIEVLTAASILAIALTSLVGAFGLTYINIGVSGDRTEATVHAMDMLEWLKAGPFVPVLPLTSDQASPKCTRTVLITTEPGTVQPNRLARIKVMVICRGLRPQIVRFETMRAEL